MNSSPRLVIVSNRAPADGLGAGGLAGLLAGSGSAAAQTGGPGATAALGEAYANVYQWAEPGGFSGPDAAKSNVPHSVGQMYFAQDTNSTYYDDGSSWVDVTPSGGGGGGTVDTADLADDAVTLPKIDGSAGSSGQVLHSDGTDVFWGVDDTGSGGSTSEAFKTNLVGSTDPANPTSGFGSEVETAIANGTPVINVTGHWEFTDTLNFSSTDDGINNVPIYLDCHGAVITFNGSDFAIHDNNGPAANGGRIPNNRFELYGGYWTASADPSGWLLMTDCAGNKIYPGMVRNFANSGGTGVGVRFAEGDLYSESNEVGGNYRDIDIGVQCNSSTGTSFQDNVFYKIQLGQVHDVGFDLSGNWIDCSFISPTVIADTNEVAFLLQNGNMGGSTIISPEFEDAQANVSQLYMVEVGPDAGRGPIVHGGDLTLNNNNIAIANTSVYPGDGSGPSGWSFMMDFQRSFASPGGEGWVREYYDPNGASRSKRTASGVVEETAAFEDLARAQSATAGRFLEWLPFALILLIPVHAAGVHFLARRSGQRPAGTVALVLSIHGHAVAYVLFGVVVLAAWVTGWSVAVTLLGPLAAVAALFVWQALSLRQVFGTSPGRAAAVSVGWGALYGLILTTVLVVAYGVALALG